MLAIKFKISLREKLLGIFLVSVVLSIGFDSILSFVLDTIFRMPEESRMQIGNMSLPAFLILFYLFTCRKITEIISLSNGLKTVTTGNLGYRAKVCGNDELSELAASVNSMIDRLQNSIAREKELETSKNELVTSLSHDLRTPLTSILGYLNLVRESKDRMDPEAYAYLDIVIRNANKLNILIDDLFLYTKSAYGSLIIKKEELDLKNLIIQLASEMGSIAAENQIEIEIGPMEGGSLIFADPVHIRRVFENIVGNALKYGCKLGKVLIGMKGEKDKVIVTVINYGRHIEPGDIENMFERMYRIQDSVNPATEGSGLGLAISRNIVNLHEGKIWAACDGNRVNVFVELPIIRTTSHL